MIFFSSYRTRIFCELSPWNSCLRVSIQENRPLLRIFCIPVSICLPERQKSENPFFMGQLAYHVSKGLPLDGRKVHQGAVLYLALEDTYHRLQSRLYRMFGTEVTPELHFAVCAKLLGEG